MYAAVVGWTFFWLMVLLKIPILALAVLVWWAVHAVPDPVVAPPATQDGEDDGGSKVPAAHLPKPRRPPRPRGPHGSPVLPSPPRVRRRARARSRLSR
jgi:hypothetical protein